jgi:hypothetical protein
VAPSTDQLLSAVSTALPAGLDGGLASLADTGINLVALLAGALILLLVGAGIRFMSRVPEPVR